MSISSRPRPARSAFTLMEVLLVLVILVVLAGMATLAIRRAQTQAYISAAKTQIGSFKMLIDKYQMDIGAYPSSDQGLGALMAPPADLRNPAKWQGPYANMKALPLDPWDSPYEYVLNGPNDFQIRSLGPDQQPDTDDDILME